MTKFRWYYPRSKILTNKGEALKIAKELKSGGKFKSVRIVPRVLPKVQKTATPRTKGFWLKVKKR